MKTEPMKTAPAEAEKIELTEITPKQKGYSHRHVLEALENIGRDARYVKMTIYENAVNELET